MNIASSQLNHCERLCTSCVWSSHTSMDYTVILGVPILLVPNWFETNVLIKSLILWHNAHNLLYLKSRIITPFIQCSLWTLHVTMQKIYLVGIGWIGQKERVNVAFALVLTNSTWRDFLPLQNQHALFKIPSPQVQYYCVFLLKALQSGKHIYWKLFRKLWACAQCPFSYPTGLGYKAKSNH